MAIYLIFHQKNRIAHKRYQKISASSKFLFAKHPRDLLSLQELSRILQLNQNLTILISIFFLLNLLKMEQFDLFHDERFVSIEVRTPLFDLFNHPKSG